VSSVDFVSEKKKIHTLLLKVMNFVLTHGKDAANIGLIHLSNYFIIVSVG